MQVLLVAVALSIASSISSKKKGRGRFPDDSSNLTISAAGYVSMDLVPQPKRVLLVIYYLFFAIWAKPLGETLIILMRILNIRIFHIGISDIQQRHSIHLRENGSTVLSHAQNNTWPHLMTLATIGQRGQWKPTDTGFLCFDVVIMWPVFETIWRREK